MAIQRIGGKMLESNLSRDTDLAFQTDLLYIDVGNDRVGIRTNAPGAFALDVNGSARVVNNLTVSGDLTVSGTTTTLDTVNTTVEDPLILLNSSGSAGNDSGIMINRSGENNAVFYWDEDNDIFKIVTSTSTADSTEVIDTAFANFQLNNLTANALATDGLSITDNTISSTRSNDNINLAPAGTGSVNVSGAKIINVANTPSGDQDAANKKYVDDQISSISSSVPELGSFTFSGNKVTQSASNADFELDNSGTGNFVFLGTTGIVLPSGDTASRPTARTGIIRYNTDTAKYEVSQDGSTWTALRTEQSAREVFKEQFTGDGSTVTFGPVGWGSSAPSAAENIIVYIDGVMQEPTENYTVDGSTTSITITGGDAPHAGARIVVINGLAESV
jgi:hypothetical protein